jgi:PAS domain-containing protein
MAQSQPLLPDGARLLHIGPYKTGSTAIQAALWEARPHLAEHGVAYPGNARRAMRPGWAVLGRKPRGRDAPRIEEWESFARAVEALGDLRVCVSSEDFGRAGPKQAARIVGDLGGERVHVVSVVRRLDKLLPSQWQERVKNYERRTFHQWLDVVLNDETHPASKRFWASHDLEQVLERWSAAAGMANMVLVVLDEHDRSLLSRAFEQLLGLPVGLLAAERTSAGNPSLNGNGAELVRRLNEVFGERGWPDQAYHHLVQRGLVPLVRTVGRSPHDVPIPALPAWAAERVAELNARRADAVKASGARVIGNPDALVVALPATDEVERLADLVPMEMAVRAVEGVLEVAIAREAAQEEQARKPVRAPRPTRTVAETSSRDLVRVVARRAAVKARRRRG